MPHMPAAIQHMDMSWFTAVHTVTNPALDWTTSVISAVTWAGLAWWALAVILWLRGYRLFAAQLAIALVIGSIEGEGLKHLFHRLRPMVMFPQDLHNMIPLPDSKWSFPSGHTLLASAAAFVILFRTWDWRGWLAIIAAVIVGYSRVYSGMHWPTDVIAGFGLGLIAAVLALLVSIPLAKKSSFSERSVSSRVPHTYSLQSKS